MVQDQIKNPIVRRFKNAIIYYMTVIKENQKFNTFLARIRSLEDLFLYTPFVDPN